jgi:3-phenylpropionate/trans-cinnamate dioxygenase ferredoxin subunit
MSLTATQPRHHVGAAEDFEEGEFRLFEIAGRPIGVVRTAGGFFAVRNRCPHQGAEICRGRISGTMVSSAPGEYSYNDEEPVLACPWHRWEFRLGDGGSVGPVTNKRLVVYEVEVEDGEVYVKLRGGVRR